ncbi:MAG: hypothetical protein AAGA54_22770 [Myxococcota bacterium]
MQLAFGTLTPSPGGFPRYVDVSRALEDEIRTHARDPWTGPELAALLCVPFTNAGDLAEQVLHALASGRLVHEPWAPSPLAPQVRTPQTPLAQLAADEAPLVAEYAVVLELVGWDDAPISRAEYRLVDPEGRVHTGHLDAQGRAEITGLRKAGACAVSFPEFDRRAWEYVAAHPL